MRYKPEQKEQTAANILAAAAREFRLGGFGGTGVDGLAKEAGVTSGAFYKHFPSKTAAFEAAVVAGLEDFRRGIETFQAEGGDEWLTALTDYYLGLEHRANLAGSCVVPGLSAEVIRSTDEVRTVYQVGLERIAAAMQLGFPGLGEQERKQRSWALLAMLTGGVILSRAVRGEKVANEIAEAAHDAVLALGEASTTGPATPPARKKTQRSKKD
ncbi:TetR/AcrR family transcriptional regulator [Geothrix fermentans]|jgi:AcrR family transcriptional regulator|uniref:TetR/AcrR family transcriptional regulator n=1 Tax=Geothrix fermentans TaxID=44676 RepID=UPI0006969B43|nr:TetR/AcrR family transcriptional regulator [Geothrix fermentans]